MGATPRRSALITGSSGGLGYAVAESLAAVGCDVVLHGIEAPDGVEPARAALATRYGISAAYYQADLSDLSALDRLMAFVADRFGGPDIVVNNAVVRHFAPVECLATADWQRSLAVNLTAPFQIIRLALPGMRVRDFGRIVNMSSHYGQRGATNRADYVTTKAGILGLTRAVALETAGTGITCNAISPGTLPTPAITARIDALAATRNLSREEATRVYMKERQPSGRFVQLEDVGAAISFLCGPAGRDITGAVIPIDGGWSAA
ncbi:SDR family oxidoreductase [Limobrevibacterium gyesilva]|uniref:SDR family oxidoreductase n=1 Tax=Limobrevibacterium gyesilva TaxID=2991712 RepID=A0AA41YMK6_9PROT|nr:SDR family oxidoreductase [Limobrevibacterium gyesilva]MCW3474763.1 SDR family oxidoreductase [Limobrevibacterium gyesilva]